MDSWDDGLCMHRKPRNSGCLLYPCGDPVPGTEHLPFWDQVEASARYHCAEALAADDAPAPGVDSLTLEQVREFQDALNAVAGDQAWKHKIIVLRTPERVEAEAAFLAASVAVWREIDRLDSRPEGYHPTAMDVDLRKAERAAWERYRDTLEPAGG